MLDTLQELKDIYESAKTAIDRSKEPKEDLRRISEYLSAVAEDVSGTFGKMDGDFQKYFYEVFASGLIKKL
jgi:hypothetical protein